MVPFDRLPREATKRSRPGAFGAHVERVVEPLTNVLAGCNDDAFFTRRDALEALPHGALLLLPRPGT
jgi:hypothetical protein